MKDIFLKIKQIKQIHNDNYIVIIFGTSEYSKNLLEMLEAFNIKVKYFSDNNNTKWGNYFCDRLIIKPDEIKKIDNPFVVIGTAFFEGISKQLTSMGVEHVYAILDATKYSATEMIEERKKLEDYFDNYKKNISNKILVKATDFIGDNVLRMGIFKALIERLGIENVYFVVHNNGVDDLIKLLTDNIIVIDKKEFINNKQYRFEVLKNINSKYFKSSISFYTRFAYATMDLLNEYNVNIQTNYIDKNCSYSRYIVDASIEFFCSTLNLGKRAGFYPKSVINELVNSNNVAIKMKLPDQYIAISMVASNKKRIYDSAKFLEVVNYILERNYNIVLLGKGKNDEEYYNELIRNTDKKLRNKIINLVSKLTLIESFKVIKNSTFFIGVDSGLSHVAYSLDKMSVIIYGCGDYGEFMHNDDNINYVVNKLECFGCHWYCSNLNANGKIKCVDDIKPEQIITSIKAIENML